MKIKFLLGLAFAFVFTFASDAQEFGIRAGGNFSTVNYEIDGESKTTDGLIGFQVGGTMLYPISESLNLNASLFYTLKGGIIDESPLKTTISLRYIQLPIALEYTFGGDQIKPFIQAGSYLSYATSGELKYEEAGNTDTRDISLGNSDGDLFTAFDYGVTFGAGVDISKFRVGINYELGLKNIYNYDEEDKWKNNSLNLNVSYFFNR